jgi:hypothetical protein
LFQQFCLFVWTSQLTFFLKKHACLLDSFDWPRCL